MKKIAGIAAIVMLLSTNFVFAQANPNQGEASLTNSSGSGAYPAIPTTLVPGELAKQYSSLSYSGRAQYSVRSLLSC
jgi:hypothetical protein